MHSYGMNTVRGNCWGTATENKKLRRKSCTDHRRRDAFLTAPSLPSQGDGLQLEYEMKLTNGQSFWTQHFSADEFGKSDCTEREGLWNEFLVAQANTT